MISWQGQSAWEIPYSVWPLASAQTTEVSEQNWLALSIKTFSSIVQKEMELEIDSFSLVENQDPHSQPLPDLKGSFILIPTECTSPWHGQTLVSSQSWQRTVLPHGGGLSFYRC